MKNSPNSDFNEKQTKNEHIKKYNYVYFIIKHKKNKQYKIGLSSYYNNSDILELIKEKDLHDNLNGPLIVKVYRFKIVSDLLKKKDEKNELEIDIILEEKNEAKYHYTIKFKDTDRDFYEYNFKIKEIDILPLELEEQFLIYLDILRNTYKKNQKAKENEDFILSSLLFLKDEDNKYDLLFYLSIFFQSYTNNYGQNNLFIFDPEKIKGIEEIPESVLKQIKIIINYLVKNPEQIHVKDEKLSLKTIKLFYSLTLYFNLKYQKEKIKDLFETEMMPDYLFDNLISYHTFFKDLILPKKDVIQLIKRAKKYEQILTLLFYLGTDSCVFLEVIKETRDIIFKFQEEEMNKNIELLDNRIDIEKYVVPKKEDDIFNIFSIIEGLRSFTVLINEDMKLIKYSSLIIEKYSEFFNEKNVSKLIALKYIVNSIKQIDQEFICKIKFDEMIHNTGLKLIKNGKIKNIEVLRFLREDIYFLDIKYSSKIYRPLEILDGIDISLFEDKNKFFKRWANINFYSMFEFQFEDFLKKIASLIKEMKDFGYPLCSNFIKLAKKILQKIPLKLCKLDS